MTPSVLVMSCALSDDVMQLRHFSDLEDPDVLANRSMVSRSKNVHVLGWSNEIPYDETRDLSIVTQYRPQPVYIGCIWI